MKEKMTSDPVSDVMRTTGQDEDGGGGGKANGGAKNDEMDTCTRVNIK